MEGPKGNNVEGEGGVEQREFAESKESTGTFWETCSLPTSPSHPTRSRVEGGFKDFTFKVVNLLSP